MNDNYIFFRYNKIDNSKNNLDLSPRTHISVISTDNNNNNKNYINKHFNKKSKKNTYQSKIIETILEKQKKQKKLDLIENGIRRLITLGKQTKKFIPTKESILYKRKTPIKNILKSKSNKKLTPFQLYEKNKILMANSLRKNTQTEKILNLRLFKSGTSKNKNSINNNCNRISLKGRFNSNIFSTPNKNYNTISCNFKNKLIQSLIEKNKNKIKIQTINDKVEFAPYNPVHSMPNSKKYLISSENVTENKRNKILNDFYIGHKRILPLYKRKLKRKNNDIFITINNYNYNLNCKNKENNIINENKSYNKTNLEEFCNNIYSRIPLVQINSIHFSNKTFSNLFMNKFSQKF